MNRAVSDGIYGYLDRLDAVIAGADAASLAALAETELVRLSGFSRAVLAKHEPDEDGGCPRCSWWWRRSRGYRCEVWVIAHRHLIAKDPAIDGTARLAVKSWSAW